MLDKIGHIGMFRVSALLFLVFSIPCFVFVKEYGTQNIYPKLRAVRDSLPQLIKTLTRTREYPGLSRFLLGRIFYADVVNTMIIFMGIYVTNELGFTDSQFQFVLMIAIISSILGAFLWGFVVDSIGPKRSLNIVLILWIVSLGLLAAIPLFQLDSRYMWVDAVLAGMAISGVWCADRPYLLRLVPPQHVGEFFGAYSIVGRFATMLGPLLWVMVAEKFGLGRPAAVLSLIIFVIIAYVILQGVDDKPRDWARKS